MEFVESRGAGVTASGNYTVIDKTRTGPVNNVKSVTHHPFRCIAKLEFITACFTLTMNRLRSSSKRDSILIARIEEEGL